MQRRKILCFLLATDIKKWCRRWSSWYACAVRVLNRRHFSYWAGPRGDSFSLAGYTPFSFPMTCNWHSTLEKSVNTAGPLTQLGWGLLIKHYWNTSSISASSLSSPCCSFLSYLIPFVHSFFLPLLLLSFLLHSFLYPSVLGIRIRGWIRTSLPDPDTEFSSPGGQTLISYNYF